MKCPFGFQIGHDFWIYDECIDTDCTEYFKCRKYRSSCIDKADFGSEIIATMEARKMSQLSKEGSVYTSYECEFCGGWHIGKSWEL